MGMKLPPDEIARLCATPGAKVGGMGIDYGPVKSGSVSQKISQSVVNADHIVDASKKMDASMKRRGNKYGAVPTIYNGVRYASKAEAARAKELDQQKATGVIRAWIGQPKYRLGVPENKFVADFFVVDADGLVRAEDVKGVRTPKFARDVKLWRAYGEYPLWIITRGKVAEIIVPEAKRKSA